MYELFISGLLVAALILRRYEWNERCLIFFSARYLASYGSRGIQ